MTKDQFPVKRCFILALAGLAFGLGFGFLGVWLDHCSQNEDHWWEVFGLPSIPGYLMAVLNWDWENSEAWDLRWAITGFNGLFWMIFTPVFAFYVHLARCIPRDAKIAYQKWIEIRTKRLKT